MLVFSTFDIDQLAKFRRHHWNERLKINKIAKFGRITNFKVLFLLVSTDFPLLVQVNWSWEEN